MRGFFGRIAIILAGLIFLTLPDAGYAQPPNPVVTISKSKVVSIGEDFSLTVTFTNTGGVGYGPYIDLFVPLIGYDAETPYGLQPEPCDGISFKSAVAHFASPANYPLTPLTQVHSVIGANTCASATTVSSLGGITVTNPPNHPHFGTNATIPAAFPTALSSSLGYELVTIPLPFTSYFNTQGPIIVEVNLHLSKFADAGKILSVFARGSFEYDTPNATGFVVEGPVSAGANITPNVVTLKKGCEQNGVPCHEDEMATGPSFPFTYGITADVDTGLHVEDLSLNDCLDNNLQYDWSGLNQPSSGTVTTNLPSPQPKPGGCISATFPGPMTGAAGIDETLQIGVHIPQAHANGTPVLTNDCAFKKGVNHVDGTAKWLPLDPRDTADADAAGPIPVSADHLIIKKCLAVQKTVSPVVAKPGDTLTYTVNFQVSDFFTIGHLTMRDVLSDGQQFDPTSAVMTINGNTMPIGSPFVSVTGNCNVVPTPWGTPDFPPYPWLTPPTGGGPPRSGSVINFNLSAAASWASILPPGSTGTITFKTKVTDLYSCPIGTTAFVDKFDRLFDYLTINGDVLDNVHPDLTAPIGHATDDSGTRVDIAPDTIAKCIYSIRTPSTNTTVTFPTCDYPVVVPINPGPLVAPGDEITFRILKTLPASDWKTLRVQDFLPTPVLSAATFSAHWGPHNTCNSVIPTTTVVPIAVPSTNSVLFNYGTHNNPNNGTCIVDIMLTTTVSGDAFPDLLVRNNQATECERNTFGEMICQNAVAPFVLGEPDLRIRKGAVAACQPINNGNGHGVDCLSWDPTHPYGDFDPAGVGLAINVPPSFPFPGPGPRFSTVLHSYVNVGSIAYVDGGDLVTFATVVENIGHSATGAFDIQINDVPPALPRSNLFVSDGTGAAFGCALGAATNLGIGNGCAGFQTPFFSGAGLYLDDLAGPSAVAPGGLDKFDMTTGKNIAVATYDMRVPSDVLLGKCFDNKAQILHYAGIEGGMNHVDPLNLPTASSKVCIRKPSVEKTIIATSEAHTGNSGGVENLAIGEIVRYRLKIRLPEGSAPSFTVLDNLPAGMGFVSDGTATVSVILTHPGSITTTPALPIGAYNSGNENTPITPLTHRVPLAPVNLLSARNCNMLPNLPTSPLQFTLGDVTNLDADTDQEVIVIEFNAQVCNVASNVAGTPLPNKAEIRIDTNGDHVPDNIGVVSLPVPAVVVEPKVKIDKSVVPGLDPYTYTYTIALQNIGTSEAFDLVLEDPLTIDCKSGLLDLQLPAGAGHYALPSGGIGVTLDHLAVGAVANIVYLVELDKECKPKSCPVKNAADVSWTSLHFVHGTTSNATMSSTYGLSGARDGERNGSTSYAPNPGNSPDLPNNYHASATENICGTLCVVKKDARDGHLMSDWEIVVDGPTDQFSMRTGRDKICLDQFIGTYSLTETSQPSWNPVSATTQTVTLTPNHTSTVTFVNTPVMIDLIIKKEVIAGPNVPASFDVNVPTFPFTLSCDSTGALPDFNLSNGGGHVQSVPVTDSCTLTENLPTNWTTPKNCHWNVSYPGGQDFMPSGPVRISLPPGTDSANIYNELVCEKVTGSLIVQKKVDNQTHANLAGWVYPINVSCDGTTVEDFNLPQTNGAMQHTVNDIPLSAVCQVVEGAVVVPDTLRTCPRGGEPVWTTTYYPGGQSASGNVRPGDVVTVVNTLTCEKDVGSITVIKRVKAPHGTDLTGVQYAFDVSCNTAAGEAFTLPASGAWQYTVHNIPSAAECKVAEGTPIVPSSVKLCPDGGVPTWTQQITPPAHGDYYGPGETVTATNILTCEKPVQGGSLTIDKVVKNNTGGVTPTSYPMTVTCNGVIVANPTVVVGATTLVTGLPSGTCTVDEVPVPVSTRCPAGTIPQWQPPVFAPAQSVLFPVTTARVPHIEVTNVLECVKPDLGHVIIEKKVDNQTHSRLSGWQYPINVSCDGATVEDFDLPLANGAMHHTVNNIANGAECKVVEGTIAVPDWYEACPRGGQPVWSTTYLTGGQNSSGYIHSGDVVTVVNTLTCEKTVDDGTGSLKVIKEVKAGPGADPTGVLYPFAVRCDGMADASFNLPDAGSWQHSVDHIPVATNCKVEEGTPIVPSSVKLCPNGGEPSWSQSITQPTQGDYYHAGEKVTVINVLQCGQRSTGISLFKTLKDKTQSWVNGPTFPVAVNCSGTAQVANLSIGAAPVTVGTLPLGSTCTITEAPPAPPANCRWETVLRWDQTNHPNGSQITNLQGPVDPRTVEVINTLNCGGGGTPPGLNVTKACGGIFYNLGPLSYVQCTITVTATGAPLPPYIAINEILVGSGSTQAGLTSVTSADPWTCPPGNVGMNTTVQCAILGSQFPAGGVSTLTALVLESNTLAVGEANNCVSAFAASATGIILTSPAQTAQVCAPLGFVQPTGSPAALVVTKTCDPLVPATAATLSHAICTITVTQTGTPVPQTITLSEMLNELISMPTGAGRITSMTSAQPWSFPALPASSNAPVTLQLSGADLAAAGGQSAITVEVDFLRPQMAGEFENCANATGSDSSGQITLTAPQVCAQFKGLAPKPDGGQDSTLPPSSVGQLKLTNAPTSPCRIDEASQSYTCAFDLSLTNTGGADFMGPMVLTDALGEPNPLAITVMGEGWVCSQPDGSTTCVNGNFELPSAASAMLDIEFTLPALPNGGNFETCAKIGLGNSTSAAVMAVQSLLLARGVDIGPVDGKMGKRTRMAVMKLQQGFGLDATGDIDEKLLMQLAIPLAQDATQSCVAVDLPANAATEVKCPDGTQLQDGLCVKPENAATICDGGQIKGGECLCPEGSKIQQFADNAYACVQPDPTSTICEGGRLKGDKCTCPEGTELQQTGDNAFTCLKPEPAAIICEGGKVRNGLCACPKGADLQQIADASFVCLQQDTQGKTVDPVPAPKPAPDVKQDSGVDTKECTDEKTGEVIACP